MRRQKTVMLRTEAQYIAKAKDTADKTKAAGLKTIIVHGQGLTSLTTSPQTPVADQQT